MLKQNFWKIFGKIGYLLLNEIIMGQRLIISEEERSRISGMYGLVNEQKEGDTTLTLDNIGEQYRKLFFSDSQYQGKLNSDLKGVIDMIGDNPWNRPERIKVDFSSAEKLEITPELEGYAKKENAVLSHSLKLNYNPIDFWAPVGRELTLIGNVKMKSRSIIIQCTQGLNDALWIFKTPDDKWKYINIKNN